MTKEENIATLNEHLEHWKRLLSEKICDQDEGEKTIDALQNAIKAMEQEPCEDCINREAVIKTISEWFFSKEFRFTNASEYLRKRLDKLPSVTPQPKMGRWIRVDKDKCRCDQCEVISFIAVYPNGDKNYCPNCGAKMQEVQESEVNNDD